MGGVGLVGLGVSGFLALRVRSQLDESNPFCNANNACRQQGLDIRDRAESSQTLSLVFLGAGVAALAGGVALYLTAPSASTKGANDGWRFAVRAGAGGVLGAGEW